MWPDCFLDIVHIIDTNTNQVSVSAHRMAIAASGMAVALINGDIIYAFGGLNDKYHRGIYDESEWVPGGYYGALDSV